MSIPVNDSVNKTYIAEMKAAIAEAQELNAEQKSSLIGLAKDLEDTANPLNAKFVKVKEKFKSVKTRLQKLLKSGSKAKLPIEHIKDQAKQFQKRNPELKKEYLILLRENIKKGDTKEDILSKIKNFYSDVSLQDEALEFLLSTLIIDGKETDPELAEQVRQARAELNEMFQREITAGRNIGVQARAASKAGLGTTTELRDLYRQITKHDYDANTLFNELSNKYAYKDMHKVLQFLSHSLGAETKSGGPSIEPGKLNNLVNDIKMLQAINGIYTHFRGRMNLVKSMYARAG